MSFTDPLAITYDGTVKNLNRVNQDNRGSDYYLDDGSMKFSVQIRHTVPPKGQAGESHMLRLDVEHYDTDGAYLHTTSAWGVARTNDSPQLTTKTENTMNALTGALSASNVTKLMGREV